MDDKHPDQGAQHEGQNPDTERTVAGAPPTGDQRVDDALAGLGRLHGKPADEHVAVLEEIHGQLRDVLGEVAETPENSEGHEQR
jgi:hypothetical protein